MTERTDTQDGIWLVAIGDADRAYPPVVQSIRRGSLVGLVRRQPPADLDDPETVMRWAVVHHECVVAAWSAAPAIPIRFGAVLSDHAAVERLLDHRRVEFEHSLRRLGALAEWDLTLTADEPATAPIAESGRAFLLSKRARLTAGSRMAERLDDGLRRVDGALHDHAIDTARADPRSPRERRLRLLSGRDGAAIEPLVTKLERTLDGLDLALAIAGPWPPYAFVEEAGDGDPV